MLCVIVLSGLLDFSQASPAHFASLRDGFSHVRQFPQNMPTQPVIQATSFIRSWTETLLLNADTCVSPLGIGTCASLERCKASGGVFGLSSTCNPSSTVCCSVESVRKIKTCDQLLDKDGFLLVKNKLVDFTGTCHTLLDVPANVCQIRLDFLSFNLSQPSFDTEGHTRCIDDGFSINAGPGSVMYPEICGDNNDQHMIIGVRESPKVSLTFRLAPYITERRYWKIKVRFIGCDSPEIAPDGCLQYHPTFRGSMKSFNHGPGNAIIEQVRYRICVRIPDDGCLIILNGVGYWLAKNLTLEVSSRENTMVRIFSEDFPLLVGAREVVEDDELIGDAGFDDSFGRSADHLDDTGWDYREMQADELLLETMQKQIADPLGLQGNPYPQLPGLSFTPPDTPIVPDLPHVLPVNHHGHLGNNGLTQHLNKLLHAHHYNSSAMTEYYQQAQDRYKAFDRQIRHYLLRLRTWNTNVTQQLNSHHIVNSTNGPCIKRASASISRFLGNLDLPDFIKNAMSRSLPGNIPLIGDINLPFIGTLNDVSQKHQSQMHPDLQDPDAYQNYLHQLYDQNVNTNYLDHAQHQHWNHLNAPYFTSNNPNDPLNVLDPNGPLGHGSPHHLHFNQLNPNDPHFNHLNQHHPHHNNQLPFCDDASNGGSNTPSTTEAPIVPPLIMISTLAEHDVPDILFLNTTKEEEKKKRTGPGCQPIEHDVTELCFNSTDKVTCYITTLELYQLEYLMNSTECEELSPLYLEMTKNLHLFIKHLRFVQHKRTKDIAIRRHEIELRRHLSYHAQMNRRPLQSLLHHPHSHHHHHHHVHNHLRTHHSGILENYQSLIGPIFQHPEIQLPYRPRELRFKTHFKLDYKFLIFPI